MLVCATGPREAFAFGKWEIVYAGFFGFWSDGGSGQRDDSHLHEEGEVRGRSCVHPSVREKWNLYSALTRRQHPHIAIGVLSKMVWISLTAGYHPNGATAAGPATGPVGGQSLRPGPLPNSPRTFPGFQRRRKAQQDSQCDPGNAFRFISPVVVGMAAFSTVGPGKQEALTARTPSPSATFFFRTSTVVLCKCCKWREECLFTYWRIVVGTMQEGAPDACISRPEWPE